MERAADRQHGDLAQIMRLRERIAAMQQRRAEPETLPVAGPLGELFPDGGLRTGASYAIDTPSASLLLALLAPPSAEGAWCAVVGLPDLSVEAAEGHGVDLSRLVLIPRPEEKWLQAASAACEVFPLVALRPPRRVQPGEAARLEARLRDRGSVLLVLGAWPGAEGTLTTGSEEWLGIGQGHGLISGREVTVSLSGRRTPNSPSVRVLLPGPLGRLEAAEGAAAVRAPQESGLWPPLRAVGA
ncbi:MAG: hypothetical protein ACTHZX_06630 [Microbacterium sp.]